MAAWQESIFSHMTPDSLAQSFNKIYHSRQDSKSQPHQHDREAGSVGRLTPHTLHTMTEYDIHDTTGREQERRSRDTPKEPHHFSTSSRQSEQSVLPTHHRWKSPGFHPTDHLGKPLSLQRHHSLPAISSLKISDSDSSPSTPPFPAVFGVHALVRHNSFPSFEDISSTSRLAVPQRQRRASFDTISSSSHAALSKNRELIPPVPKRSPSPEIEVQPFEFQSAMVDKLTPSSWQPFPFGHERFIYRVIELYGQERACMRAEQTKLPKAAAGADSDSLLDVHIPTATGHTIAPPKPKAKKKIKGKSLRETPSSAKALCPRTITPSGPSHPVGSVAIKIPYARDVADRDRVAVRARAPSAARSRGAVALPAIV